MDTLSNRFVRNTVALYQEAGIEWLERLPAIIADYERRWSITAQAPFANLSYNYVAPAVRADGTEAILKIGVPNPELATEIEALLLYKGRGCAQLLEVDRDRGAFLLERLRPGTPLASMADDDTATRIAARVMRQLWRPAPAEHTFPSVTRWAAGLKRLRTHFEGGTGPLPAVLVEKAESLFVELLDSMEDPVLLHGDLHHENILRAERHPWLAIDPKGVVGEPTYEAGAILRNPLPQLLQQPRPSQVLARRVDILATELDCDRDRLLGWGFAQAVLAAWWCIEDHTPCWEELIRVAEFIDEAMGLRTAPSQGERAMTLPIATERLILRRYTHNDIQDILGFVSHPSVVRATPEIEATESGVKKYIDMQNCYQPFEKGKCFDLAIERREDGKVIGLLSLVRKEHKQGEIGYALGKEYRGQGYATEAARALMTYGFDLLGLHRIQARTTSANPDSWRVMERLGMRREVHLREAEFRDGRWLDTLIYGTLATECHDMKIV